MYALEAEAGRLAPSQAPSPPLGEFKDAVRRRHWTGGRGGCIEIKIFRKGEVSKMIWSDDNTRGGLVIDLGDAATRAFLGTWGLGFAAALALAGALL